MSASFCLEFITNWLFPRLKVLRVSIRVLGQSLFERIALDLLSIKFLLIFEEAIVLGDGLFRLAHKSCRISFGKWMLRVYLNLLMEEITVELVDALSQQRVRDRFRLLVDNVFNLVDSFKLSSERAVRPSMSLGVEI